MQTDITGVLQGGDVIQPNIEIKKAVNQIRDGAFVIDVRRPDEFQTGHLDGSLNIPVDELPNRLSEIPQNQPIVVYCAVGGRAEKAKSLLSAHSNKSVTNGGGYQDLARALTAS